MYVHMGFQKPHAYQEVHECVFTDGRLDQTVDHSETFRAVREAIQQGTAGAPPEGHVPARREIMSWIHHSFDLDYRKWGIFRDPDAVWAGRTGVYTLSLEDEAERQAEVEQTMCAIGDVRREMGLAPLDREQRARQLYGAIEREGWRCTHCGRAGAAGEDFRLSIGPVSCVMCRHCGWPQDDEEEER
jgi:hypothetical protein